MAQPAFPQSHNVFIPDHEGSGKLVVDYSRNPNRFPVASYCQFQNVKKTVGYYLQMTVEEAGRILNTDLADFAWPDGAEAPKSFDGTESFLWQPFRCERYAFDVPIGDLTSEQASWNIIEQHARIKLQQALTARTLKVVNALETVANWDSSHTADVATGISGNTGKWDASTTARQDIKRSLNHAANQILLSTLSAVNINELMVVMSPGCAKKISETQEIVDHIKGSPDALAQVRGELPGRNAIFGLPDKLYGFPVVIEDTAKVTSRKGATRAASYVKADATPVMVARPGGLEGVAEAPTFSTMVLFLYEELAVERQRDSNNRRVVVRVVENYDAKLVSSISGFLFQAAV